MATGSAADLTIIDVLSGLNIQAFGLDNHGDIGRLYRDAAGQQHAFVIRQGRLSSIDVPDSTFTGGFAIKTEGEVTGHYGSQPDGKMRGYLPRNGVFTTLGAEDWGLRNSMRCGYGIDAEQYSVGHFQDGTGQQGFLRTGSEFTPIDNPEAGATNTNTYRINPQGEVGGYCNDNTGKTRGFFRGRWGDFTPVDIPRDSELSRINQRQGAERRIFQRQRERIARLCSQPRRPGSEQ